MVVLGGWAFLMSEVPLYLCPPTASERRGNIFKGVKDFNLIAKALTVLYVPHSLDSGLPQSVLAHQSSEPGLFPEPKLTDLYREPSMTAQGESVDPSKAELAVVGAWSTGVPRS